MRPINYCIFILSALLFYGCGGAKLISPEKKVEITLSDDLAKEFAVSDGPQNEMSAEKQTSTSKTKEVVKKSKMRADKKDNKKQTQQSEQASAELIHGPGTMKFKIPRRRPVQDPLWVGERIHMDITWLKTKAGESILEVLPFKFIEGHKVYHFKVSAKTSDLFSIFYRAEDFVESFVDFEGLFPYKFILHGNETKHIRNNIELFDHGAKRQYVHLLDNRVQEGTIYETKEFKDLDPLSQDAVSSLYFARMQKFDIGTTIRFPMTASGSIKDIEAVGIKKEEINTPMGYFKTVKVKVQTIFNGVLQQKGDSFIWFTDDERRFPVRFEAKVRIGWVEGIVKKIEYGVQPTENVSAHISSDAEKEAFYPAQYESQSAKPTTNEVAAENSGVKKTPEKLSSKQKRSRKWFKDLLNLNKSNTE